MAGLGEEASSGQTALDGFVTQECDDRLSGWLRAQVEAARGTGYDHFEFNLFEIELHYGQGRATIAEVVPLGYADVEVSLAEFLAALPDVPPISGMPRPPKRAIIPPPPASG